MYFSWNCVNNRSNKTLLQTMGKSRTELARTHVNEDLSTESDVLFNSNGLIREDLGDVSIKAE